MYTYQSIKKTVLYGKIITNTMYVIPKQEKHVSFKKTFVLTVALCISCCIFI